jgi:hypothetical protein
MNHVIHVSHEALSEAVGCRATRGMDREALGTQVPDEQRGTCDSGRLSIHVPARKGRLPPPDKGLCSP